MSDKFVGNFGESMNEIVLLVTEEENLRDAVARRLINHGLEVIWRKSPKDAAVAISEEKPAAIVINLEDNAKDSLQLCKILKSSPVTGVIPLLGISSMKEMPQIETILEQGVDDHVSRPFHVSKLLAKIDRLLEIGHRAQESGQVSEIVEPLFEKIRKRSSALGDSVEIFSGVVERPTLPAQLASLTPGKLIWRDILQETAVQRFHIRSDVRRVRFDRLGLIQMPSAYAIDQPETVILRRTAEPFVAAVDRGGYAVCSRLFTIVPVMGLTCEYLTCLLNSRLIDFWVRRVIRANPRHIGAFTPEDICRLPLVIPSARQQRKILKIHIELEKLAAEELTPESQLKQAKTIGQMNRLLFSHFGLNKDDQEKLAFLSH